MIEVSFKDQMHEIYENRKECKRARVTSLVNCDVGDRVLSKNGYYVPVLAVKTSIKNFKGRELTFKFIYLPNKTVTINIDNPRSFNYLINKESPTMGVRDYAWIEFINKGMDFITAGKVAYTQFDTKILMTKLNNPVIMDKLRVRINMKALTDKLKEKNINEEFIAEEISEILKDRSVKNNTLRKWALETTIKLLEKEPDTAQKGNNLQSASDSLSELMSTISN